MITFNEGVMLHKEYGIDYIEHQAMMWNRILENSREVEEYDSKPEMDTYIDWDFNPYKEQE